MTACPGPLCRTCESSPRCGGPVPHIPSRASSRGTQPGSTRHQALCKGKTLNQRGTAVGRSMSQLLTPQRHDSGAHSSRSLRGSHGRELTHRGSNQRPAVRRAVSLPPLPLPSLPLTLVSWPRFPKPVSSLLSVRPKRRYHRSGSLVVHVRPDPYLAGFGHRTSLRTRARCGPRPGSHGRHEAFEPE